MLTQRGVFREYLDRKVTGAAEYAQDSSGIRVGDEAEYRGMLKYIVQLMIQREQYGNIPIADLPEEYHDELGILLGEDVIVRKDLVSVGAGPKKLDMTDVCKVGLLKNGSKMDTSRRGGYQTWQDDKSVAQIAKTYGVHPNSVNKWQRDFLDKGPEVFAQDGVVAEYEQRIADLERLLGKKEIEIALLKNFLGQTK
jgi:hypothetical protein